MAVDAVFDSKSITTTFKKELLEHGIIFCSISEAVQEYPDLIRKHMGSVVRTFLHLFLNIMVRHIRWDYLLLTDLMQVLFVVIIVPQLISGQSRTLIIKP